MIDSFEGEYRFLSNFYEYQISYEGKVYPTVEHAFQAAKSFSADERERVRRCESPGRAKREGRRLTLRSDWETVKEEIMLSLLQEKFLNPDLRQKLINTTPHELVEGNWWGDTYWGVCHGEGENRLGKLLMQVRDSFFVLGNVYEDEDED